MLLIAASVLSLKRFMLVFSQHTISLTRPHEVQWGEVRAMTKQHNWQTSLGICHLKRLRNVAETTLRAILLKHDA
jgi:hypothetical protein